MGSRRHVIFVSALLFASWKLSFGVAITNLCLIQQWHPFLSFMPIFHLRDWCDQLMIFKLPAWWVSGHEIFCWLAVLLSHSYFLHCLISYVFFLCSWIGFHSLASAIGAPRLFVWLTLSCTFVEITAILFVDIRCYWCLVDSITCIRDTSQSFQVAYFESEFHPMWTRQLAWSASVIWLIHFFIECFLY